MSTTPGPWRAGRSDMLSYGGGNEDRPWKNVYRPAKDDDPLHLGQLLPVVVARAFGDTEEEVFANADLIAQAPILYERLLKSEALNAELARMLRSLEWSYKRSECPLCRAQNDDLGHDPDCALAALLKKATTE